MTEEEAFQQAPAELDAEMPKPEQAPSQTPHRTKPMDLDEAYRLAAEMPDEEEATPTATPPVAEARASPPPSKSLLQRGVDLWKSAGAGIAKAGFETKDFLVGEPAGDQKSALRRGIEHRADELSSESTANALTMGVSQMVTGLVGAGKVMAPVKAAKWFMAGGKAAKAGYEIARGASAGYVVLDPHEERLSNLVESFPALQNPVTAYLSASPNDTAAEGRFKNALESIGADLALVGVVKTIRYLRNGDQVAAKAEIGKLGKREAVSPEIGLDRPQQPTEGHTGALTPEGPAVPAKDETLAGESPRVKESGADAIAQPATSVPMELTDAQMADILKGAGEDREAIRRYGSKEAAAEAGQIIQRGTSSLPWQKMRDTDEVMALAAHASRVFRDQMDVAKGGAAMSDAKVNAMVEARAAMFGEDPQLIMGQLREAGDAARGMVADMEAGYLFGSKVLDDAYTLSFRMENGLETNLEEAGKELKRRLLASADFLGNAQAISSNSGRALRRMRGQFRITPEFLEKVKTMDGQDLARLFTQTKGDPKQLAQTVNPTFLQRVTDEVNFSLVNAVLWNYPTHLVNATSNLYMLLGRPTEKLLGSLAIGPKEGSNLLRTQAIKEYSYTVASLGDAWSALKDAFMRGDSALSPHNTEYFRNGTKGQTTQQPLRWKPVRNIGDMVENGWNALTYRNVVGLPTRALGAADEFFKTLRYRAVIQAKAATEANAMGLQGADFHSFVEREMEKAIDPASGMALDERALREAQTTTFQQDLLPGTVGESILIQRQRHPVLTMVLPFVKTPVNVLRYGWKMTPGINLLQREFREAIQGTKGAEAKAHAVGQMALGSTFMGLSAILALNGKITGGGPQDPKLQQELRSTGWRPYSYVIGGEDGTKRYIPIGRMDPAGLSFSIVADLVDIMRAEPDSVDAEKGIFALSMALAHNFTDRTFLQNIHQALEAVGDTKGDKGEKYLASLAGNTIPLSSAMKGINPDPYLREARSFVDMTLKNVPGYSSTLPPRRDAFGDPVLRTIGLSTTQNADLVEAEHNRIMIETGKTIGRPDPGFEGLDLRDITLKSGRNAYDRLAELSGHLPKEKPLKELLSRLIKSKAYQERPDGDPDVKGTRIHALSLMVGKYRDAARKALVVENPELQQYIKARQRAAFGAIAKNRTDGSNGQGNARAILDALAAQAPRTAQQ